MTYFLLILDLILYGLLPIFIHYFVQDVDPLLFGGLMAFFGSIPFIFAAFTQGRLKEVYAKKFITLFVLTAIFSTLGDILFFSGTKLSTGINSGLLLQIEPVYSVILSAIILREVIKKRKLTATLLMIFGAMVILYKGPSKINIGDLLIVFSPFFYQLSSFTAKEAIRKKANLNSIAAARLFYGGIILSLIALVVNPSSIITILDGYKLLSIVFSGLYLGFLFFLWYRVLKQIPVSRATAFLPLSAASAFLGSMFFIKEPIYSRHYIGLILIIAGLIALTGLHIKEKKL